MLAFTAHSLVSWPFTARRAIEQSRAERPHQPTPPLASTRLCHGAWATGRIIAAADVAPPRHATGDDRHPQRLGTR